MLASAVVIFYPTNTVSLFCFDDRPLTLESLESVGRKMYHVTFPLGVFCVAVTGEETPRASQAGAG